MRMTCQHQESDSAVGFLLSGITSAQNNARLKRPVLGS